MFKQYRTDHGRDGDSRRQHRKSIPTRLTAGLVAMVLGAGVLPAVLAPAVLAAPVGQGLTLNAGDMRFILKQIKIAENNATKEDAQGNPVAGQPLLGTGANQVANPLLPYGLRTVDGSGNNLIAGQEKFGSTSLPFPRLAAPQWRNAPNGQSYKSVNTNISDGTARFISNVIVDQTDTNPAAIAAASRAHRTVNDEPTAIPCTSPGVPVNCVAKGETLDIPNVTTDFGLSPPYNGMFALFGQFFDHGVDSTRKSKSMVMMPLAPDDPLFVVGSRTNFMVLSRAENQPGPDGILGTADDVQDGTNTNSPWVDQSQTYSSHPAHQVFLREYSLAGGKPVSTGELLEGVEGVPATATDPGTPGGMATWQDVKDQAATLLGLELSDADIGNIPMIATDQYGRFLRGPSGLPQYVKQDKTLVEGNLTTPVPVPADVQRINIAFLDDIAHTASPFNSQTGALLLADGDTAVNPVNGPPATTYDDEMLDQHFIAGDGRVNENVGLTAIHQVFHSEHNRLVTYMEELLTSLNLDLNEWKLGDGTWNGERLFQAARFVTEMEYQHLVFEEFARKIQPGINPFNVFTQADTGIDPAVKAEFAHATYRFGHSMLTEDIDRKTNTGTDIGMPLLEGFLNPPAYYANGSATMSPAAAAGSIAMGMTDQVGAELDEFVTDTLRNNVLGLPLDLAALNLARGHETGVPSLNNFRSQLYTSTGDSSLKPYTSWVDFGQALKHPDSVVNFMAAYGQHPSIKGATSIAGKRAAAQLLFDMNPDPTSGTPADAYDFVNSTGTWATTQSGLNDVDLWVGGLAEMQNLFGGLLGSTFNYIFERQMTDLQDGDRLYYLSRTSGLNLRTELEGNSFAELIMRNTDASALKAEVFGVADCEFEMANIVATSGNSVADDPASACNESALLLRMADGTIRYRVSNSIDRPGLNAQSTFNGTAGTDRIWGGIDNDTFWGNDGSDILEGSDGADTVLGGKGNDRITDSHGDDVLKGGPDNDAIDAGPGLDIIMSGDGADFSNGGLNGNEHFAGEGDDLVIAGDGPDAVFGGGGNDWVEGGNANDLLQGDSGAPFFDDVNNPGHDVLIGDSGEDDYDSEGGDDVMVAGPGIERNHGVYGFDWVTHARSIERGDSDMRMLVVEGPNALRDRFLLVEGLSGWDQNDVLRGTDVAPADEDIELNAPALTNILDAEGIGRIGGLSELLPTAATSFGAGNIIIGGSGSDEIWGNGADDIIDGDKWLNVRLSVRDDADAETRTANSLTEIQADIMAGRTDPGKVEIVREILSSPGTTDVDTAMFSGARAEYTITKAGAITTVTHTGGTAEDGTDTITNVELLKFTDATVEVSTLASGEPTNAAPTVTTRTPAADAVGVAGNSDITATFSETVTGVSGTTMTLTNPAGTVVPGAVTYDAVTGVATLNPTADLAANTVYTVNLTGGIVDAGGAALAPVSWSFTTAAAVVPVNPAPTVTTQAPAANAVGVTVGTNIDATFSETVTGVSGTTMTLTNPAGTVVPGAVTYNSTTRVATLNPTADLAANTVYTVNLTGGIVDAGGAALAPVSWSFTTAAAVVPVNPAPTVTTQAPAANAVGVTVGTNIDATFSETVTGVSGTTMTLTNPAGTVVPGAVTYNSTTRVATLNPTADLAANTVYTVNLTGGIVDAGGAALAPVSWSFTTAAAVTPPVNAAPTVTSQSPAAGAVGVGLTFNVSATFSEAVTGVSTTTMRLTNPAGGTVSAAVTYNATTRVATLNPAFGLASNSRYTVTLTSGIRDTSGVALVPVTYTFTTGSTAAGTNGGAGTVPTTGTDTTAPTVTTRAPATGAVGVAVGTNVDATFNETVTGVSVTTVTLRAGASALVPAVVTYNATTRVATLNPSANLTANTVYTVNLTAGIRDGANNALAPVSWSFTTAAAVTPPANAAPTVTTRTPAAGAVGVANTTNVDATFSEAVTGVSTTTMRLTNPAGGTVSAAVTYNATTRVATLNPAFGLASNSRYTVTLTSGIRDTSGVALVPVTWTFTTR